MAVAMGDTMVSLIPTERIVALSTPNSGSCSAARLTATAEVLSECSCRDSRFTAVEFQLRDTQMVSKLKHTQITDTVGGSLNGVTEMNRPS